MMERPELAAGHGMTTPEVLLAAAVKVCTTVVAKSMCQAPDYTTNQKDNWNGYV
jgi:hypothetical protein